MTDSKTLREEYLFFRLFRRIEAIPGKRPETVFFILYVALLGVIAFFHEPWFDEAQAWQIARCASLRDLLLTIPHYEGHPPLWHLLLMLPAKLGAPYELCIKAVNIAICASASGLLIFRSPFPRALRFSLPFTYFLFYQYGVISRPYSLMFLAFMLAAMVYPNKDEKPFRFVLALMLLCLSHAYGIVFAGGIAIAWLLEIYRKQKSAAGKISIFHDKRIGALFLLLLFALINIWLILPKSDAFAVVNKHAEDSIFTRLLYMFVVLPADAWFYEFFNTDTLLSKLPMDPASLSVGIILGLLFWVILFSFSKKRKTILLLLIPYSLYAVFGAAVYFSQHHIGTAALFLLFWAWVSAAKKTDGSTVSSKTTKRFFDKNPSAHKILPFAYPSVCAFVVLVSISWSAVSSINEVGTAYAYGRDAARFIKANGLDDLYIMTGWREIQDPETGEIVMDTNHTAGGVALLPYFQTNIIGNVNDGIDSLAYVKHIAADFNTNRKNLKNWASRGIPDLLIGYVDLHAVYGPLITQADYAPVYELKQTMLWKTDIPRDEIFSFLRQYIYLRRDLLPIYGLTEIETDSRVYIQNTLS